jgi:O-antigen/teichoic acid export membrane protein
MPQINAESVATATKWSALAEIAARVASPIVNIVLARILTPEAFGIVASITIITSFADIFTDAGFQKFIIQHDYKDEAELNNASNVAFTANCCMAAIIYFIIFLFNKPLSAAVGCRGAELAVLIASSSVFFTAIPSVATARFRRSLDFKSLFYVRIVSAFIPIVLTVPLAILLKSYWALLIGTLGQKAFIAIVTTKLSKWKAHVYFKKIIFDEMFSFSFWNLLETLSIWFAAQANIFIVSNVLNSYYLGLYKTAMSTVNSCLGLITASITPVFFSTLSRYQSDKIKYTDTFFTFQYLIALLVIPLGVGMYVYRDFLLNILLGKQWVEATDFIGLWSLVSVVVIVYSQLACEVYRSYGKPKVSLIIQICYMVIYVPVIYFSAIKGFSTLSYAGSLVRLVCVLIDLIVLNYVFSIPISSIIKNTGYYIISSMLMGCVGIYLRSISSNTLWNVCSILICVAFYFACIFINKRQRQKFFSLEIIKESSLLNRFKHMRANNN